MELISFLNFQNTQVAGFWSIHCRIRPRINVPRKIVRSKENIYEVKALSSIILHGVGNNNLLCFMQMYLANETPIKP